MKRKNQGFTLVELLAVIVVLAIIMVIAIPSVLNSVNNAKKESFYLYAHSLQSKALDKYIQQLESDPENTDCVVYNVDSYKTTTEVNGVEKEVMVNDLDLSDTGNYEGWVRVKRIATSSGKRRAVIEFENSAGLEYVKYCIAKYDDNNYSQCKPDTSYYVEEDKTKASVIETIKKDYQLCANYQYPEKSGDNTILKTSTTKCQKYSDAKDLTDTYTYEITMTLKDSSYAVENVTFNSDDMSMQEFYKAIDKYKTDHKENYQTGNLAISSPTCGNDSSTIKGTTTTHQTEIVTAVVGSTRPTCSANIDNTFNIKFETDGGTSIKSITQCVGCGTYYDFQEPTKAGYTFDGWYLDKSYTEEVDPANTQYVPLREVIESSQCVTGYADVTVYAKWNKDATTPITTETTVARTTEEKTTNITEAKTTEVKTTDTTQVTTTSTTTNTHEVTTTTTTVGYQEYTTSTTTIDTTDYTLLLNTLNIAGQNIDFSPVKFYYELTVPYSVSRLDITYEAVSPDVTTVQVVGADNLGVGTNNIAVALFNTETGKESFYRILVTRLAGDYDKQTSPVTGNNTEWNPESGLPDPTIEDSNATLASLTISGYVFNFDPLTYDYTVEIKEQDSVKVGDRKSVV